MASCPGCPFVPAHLCTTCKWRGTVATQAYSGLVSGKLCEGVETAPAQGVCAPSQGLGPIASAKTTDRTVST